MTLESTFPRTPGPVTGTASPPHREPALIRAAESGLVPDFLLRFGIRRLCAQRLVEEHHRNVELRDALFRTRLRQWGRGPLAVSADAANAQHYEVPPRFFEQVLGRHLKYSCAYWDEDTATLDDAEARMLGLTAERAGLADGQRILELGCGWGSLTLWMAHAFPGARITAVSNSADQRRFIEARVASAGLANVEVITADINDFQAEGRFDRVVSVEMFEHVRNHAELLRRVRGWLEDDGAAFVHVFCHRELCYPFESNGDGDWMARHFFTGGMMPSYDLFLHHNRDLRVAQRWWLSGMHYARTSEAWLANLDARRGVVEAALAAASPPGGARVAAQRWRMFFLAVAEMFGYGGGHQWGVGHYLLRPGRAGPGGN